MFRLHVAELNMSEIVDRPSVTYSVSKRDLWEDSQKRSPWVCRLEASKPAQAAINMTRLSHDNFRSAQESRRYLTRET